MPGGDRTGPVGAVPMTGRGAGYCAGYSMPGYANSVGGRGLGRFGGRGFRGRVSGWCRGGYGFPAFGVSAYQQPPVTPDQEAQNLKDQVRYLEDTLSNIKSRLEQLQSTKD